MTGFIVYNNFLTIGILCVKFVSVTNGIKQLTKKKRSKSKLKIQIGHLFKEINNGSMRHKFNSQAHVIPYEI